MSSIRFVLPVSVHFLDPNVQPENRVQLQATWHLLMITKPAWRT